MPESTGTGPARKVLEHFLEQEYGSVDIDQDGDFMLRRHGALTWIRTQPVGDEHTAVIVYSPAVIGAKVDGELTRFLATEGLNIDLAHFELHERAIPMVVVSHTLLGEYLSRDELTTAVEEVSAISGRYGPQISKRFGGSAPGTLLSRQELQRRALAKRFGRRSEANRTPPAAPVRTRAAFGLLALTGGIIAGTVARNTTSSWWVTVFTFAMVYVAVGVVGPEVFAEPNKLRRAAYYGSFPVFSTVILALGYWISGRWWPAVLLGLVLGLLGAGILGAVCFDDIATEELAQAKELGRSWYLAGGST